MPFTATMNTPGYLPWSDDEPPLFEASTDAWEFLADERERQEDSAADWTSSMPNPSGYSAAYHTLLQYAGENHGPDVVYGDTPGYDGSHDLGVAYSVTELPISVTRCPCCGDDVMDVPGIACKECRATGCEATTDASGERGYTECQRTDSLADTDDTADMEEVRFDAEGGTRVYIVPKGTVISLDDGEADAETASMKAGTYPYAFVPDSE